MPTFNSLYEDNREALRWTWIAGRSSSERLLDTPATAGLASADLVGHLNLIHPNRLHVLGEAEVRYYTQMEPGRGEANFGRLDLQTRQLQAVARSRTTALDPLGEQTVFPTSLLQLLAPFVHRSIGRLDEHQAFRRLLQVDAQFVGFPFQLGERFVIELHVVTEERQAQASAALERAVATATVATLSPQQGNNVLLEVGRFIDRIFQKALSGRAEGICGVD